MGDKKIHDILAGVNISVASNSLELSRFNVFIPMIYFYLNGFSFFYFLMVSNGYESSTDLQQWSHYKRVSDNRQGFH